MKSSHCSFVFVLLSATLFGQITFQATFGVLGMEQSYSGKQTSDGGYLVLGYTPETIGGFVYDIYLTKLDPNGKVLWSKLYGGSNNEFGFAVEETDDGTQGNGGTSALGGTSGNGGSGTAPSGVGSGGAGWLSNGGNSSYGTGCTGGLTFPFFTGGTGSSNFGSSGQGDGGYGGGGGAVCGNGGGGGYSGGGGGEGSICRAGGGGGGSYNIGTNQSNSAGVQLGNGLATITVVGFSTNAILEGSLSPNDTVCIGTIVTANGNYGSGYVWDNGILDGVAFTADSSVVYQLIGTDTVGCVDTVYVPLTVNPLPIVNLGADIIQANPPAVLNAGSGFISYLWNTSETSQTINVTSNGSYNVLVTDANGCSNADTIEVYFTAGIVNSEILKSEIIIQPNPSNGVITINIHQLYSDNLSIRVSDLSGKTIHNEIIGEVSGTLNRKYNFEYLQNGVYIIEFIANGISKQLKWIKN